jgi:glycosyltransferase involved in cell wall biosynthesis
VISILLPVYNGEKYIRQSIDSIAAQTFKDWELLVGFNGTTDSSKDILAEYNDLRIKVFDYGEDKGKAKTLNKLIKEAKYDWIALQDDDDVWLPTKLEKQITYMKEYDVIGTFIRYINEDSQPGGTPNLATTYQDIKNRSLSGDNQTANTTAIFKKSAALDIGGWDTSIDGIEDFDLWIRLLKKGYRFHNIPENLTLHRLHAESNFNTKPYDPKSILK